MVRMIFVWVALSLAIALSTMQVRQMTGRQIWSMTKTLAFGTVCSTVALLILILIVVLF